MYDIEHTGESILRDQEVRDERIEAIGSDLFDQADEILANASKLDRFIGTVPVNDCENLQSIQCQMTVAAGKHDFDDVTAGRDEMHSIIEKILLDRAGLAA